MYFDGASTTVRVNRTADFDDALQTEELTFEAWIRPDEEIRAQAVAMLGDLGWGVMLMCNPSDGAGLGCCGHHLTNSIGFWTVPDPNDDEACSKIPSSSEPVVRVEWNHMAVTARVSVVKFYHNGRAVGDGELGSEPKAEPDDATALSG